MSILPFAGAVWHSECGKRQGIPGLTGSSSLIRQQIPESLFSLCAGPKRDGNKLKMIQESSGSVISTRKLI